jgi:hypothetical protein
MSKPQRTMLGYFALKYDFLKEGLFTFIQKLDKNRLKGIVNTVYNDTDARWDVIATALET